MKQILWAGLAAALVAAGCGGGDGGGGSTSVQLPPPVTITSANRDAVATATASVFVSVGNAGAVVPLSTGDRATASAPIGEKLIRIASKATLSAVRIQGNRVTALAVIPIPPPPDLCPDGGSATMSLDDLDNNGEPSIGETVTVQFTNCRDGGDTVNGRMTIVITAIGSLGQSLSAGLSFADLRTTSSDGTATLNGGVSLTMSFLLSGAMSSTVTVGTSGLVSSIVTAGYSETLTLGAGLAVETSFDPTLPVPPPGSSILGRTLMQVNGAVGSSRLNGSFTITTVEPITLYEADLYPRAGQTDATGASGSKLRMTVLNETTVRLELDANGDGSFEQTVDKPWSEIL